VNARDAASAALAALLAAIADPRTEIRRERSVVRDFDRETKG
jgi:hypothetical protein